MSQATGRPGKQQCGEQHSWQKCKQQQRVVKLTPAPLRHAILPLLCSPSPKHHSISSNETKHGHLSWVARTRVAEREQEAQVLQPAALLHHDQVDEAVAAVAVPAGQVAWAGLQVSWLPTGCQRKCCNLLLAGATAPCWLASSSPMHTHHTDTACRPCAPAGSPRHALLALLGAAGHDDQHDACKVALHVHPLGAPVAGGGV